MKSFLLKIKSKLSQNKDCLIALGILFVMFNLTLLINSDWPYGKNSLLVSDSFHQIGMLFEHIFQVFKGEASLFYTNHIGGGFEIFSTLQYMFANPFYLIVLCGGAKYYFQMFTFALLFMLCFNLIVFFWFSKKHFKNLSPVSRIFLSLLYVFSGYVVQNYSFITWLIFPGVILLVIDKFLKMLSTGKMTGFICMIVWQIITCYSVGISTIIICFLLFSAYIFFTYEKGERKPEFTKLFVSFLIAGLVCIILLFPSIIDVLSTNRSSSILQNLLVLKSVSFIRKISVLFADSLVLLGAILYFIKCNKKDGKNKFFIFAFVILFMPVLFDTCQKMLCGSSYMGFTSRLYFLNEALIFILTLKFLNDYKFEFSEEKKSKFPLVLFSVTLSILLLGCIILVGFTYKSIGGANKSQSVGNNFLTLANFLVCLTAVLGAVAMIVLCKKKVFTKLVAKIITVVLLVFTIGFNFISFAGGANTSLAAKNDFSRLVAEYNLKDKNIKCIGKDESAFPYNIPSSANTNSVFSSLISKDTIDFYSIMGHHNTNVYVSGSTSSIVSDILSGIEYYVFDKEEDRPYLEFVAKTENLYLYKNKFATTGAFFFDEEITFDNNKNFNSNIKTLFEKFGLDSDFYAEIKPDAFDEIKEIENATKKYTFTAKEDGILYLNTNLFYDGLLDKEHTIYSIGTIAENCSGEIAYLSAGQSYTFCLNTSTKYTSLDDVKFEFVKLEAVEGLYLKLKDNQVNLEFNKNGYKASVNAETDGYLHIFKPKIKGEEFLLNNANVESLGQNAFVSLKLSAGENQLTMKFCYPHTTSWIIVSVVLIILIIAIAIIYHFTKFKHLQTVITYAIYGINCCILAIFYFIGLLLSFIGFSL